MRDWHRLVVIVAACTELAFSTACADQIAARPAIVAGEWDEANGAFILHQNINDLVGAGTFYAAGLYGQNTRIGNIEAGHVWGEHLVFDRADLPEGWGIPDAPSLYMHHEGADGGFDAHATAVGHMLSGTGFTGDEHGWGLYSHKMGLAPFSDLWSGAIATELYDDGSFSISIETFLKPYLAFTDGSLGATADVINSSWGTIDPAGNDVLTQMADSLARANTNVTWVMAAGNDPDGIGGMGSGYNSINVGSLGGSLDDDPYNRPSWFTQAGPADFYNPETKQTIEGVRSVVHIAAPGEHLVAAAYISENEEDKDLYWTGVSGTSFSSPIVAGGVALLKDLSYYDPVFEDQPEARDTRVIRSVLMAGARKTLNWDNGQNRDEESVLVTTQSLDYQTGAGALDLAAAKVIYEQGAAAQSVANDNGNITFSGWDYNFLQPGESRDYVFADDLAREMQMTISLNWMAHRTMDEGDQPQDASLANLDLEVWQVEGSIFATKMAASQSAYNNSEFLRFDLQESGIYGIRVAFNNWVYGVGDDSGGEVYSVAWHVIPEPGTAVTIIFSLLALGVFIRRFRARLSDIANF